MIINSLLDTDLYKFTMAQTVLHRFPNTQVEYKFKCRTPGVNLAPLIPQIQQELYSFCAMKFTKEELDYLRSLRFIKPDFVDFLRHFQPCDKFVELDVTKDGQLDITISGPWIETIWFEVPLLAIVNELYFKQFDRSKVNLVGLPKLNDKIKLITDLNDPLFRVAEFGTRRRFSQTWHSYMLQQLKERLPNNLHGTSNVQLAMKYNLTPIGTMAHEYLQAMQALVRISESQKFALQNWADEYRGDLGIALTDVVGKDAFLRDFDLYFCKLFDGVRHDSGKAESWMNDVIEHYKKMGIDPRTKIAVFSDGLDVPRAIQLYKHYKGFMKMLFAIGTNLTNDVGFDPLNIVIKMTKCNGQAVAKLSDSEGKQMCQDDKYLEYLKQVFKVGENK